MSGGSFNYMYARIEEEYSGEMEDLEMELLLKDFCSVLHDLEWYRSGDYGEEDYRRAVADFKKKWLRQSNEQRAQNTVDYALDKLKTLRGEIEELLK